MRCFIVLSICVSLSLCVFSQGISGRFGSNFWYDSGAEIVSDSSAGLNFHLVRSFGDSVSPIKFFHDVGLTSRLSVIVVFHSSDTLAERGLWGVFRDGKQFTGLTDNRLRRPHSEYFYPVKRRGIPLINTSMQAFSKVRGGADSSYFVLGAAYLPDSTLSSFSGEIAECLVFDRFLQKREALQIETYLAIKYGITLIASDYISSSEMVLWHYESNSLYSNGIAGIGKDSIFGLEQKQGSSSEEPDLLTMNVGDFFLLNSDNPYLLDNEDFILWGHDDGGLVFESAFFDDSLMLLSRKWLVQRTNSSNNLFPTDVKFSLPAQYKDSVQTFSLAIDRSGTGDFSSSEIAYFTQDSIDTAGFVYFRDIVWDLDGNGKDVFTFSYRTDFEEETDRSDTLLSKKSQKSGSDEDFLEVVSSMETGQPSYRLYPNPTTGSYRLEADFPQATSVVLRICTINGHQLSVKQDAGKTHYAFDGYIDGQGSYVLEIESVFGLQTFKLSVVK